MKFKLPVNWKEIALYRFEQLLILIAHLALLKWILHVLNNSGKMIIEHVIYHFIGMGIAGALLIRICAYLAKRRYLKAGGKMHD